MLIPISEKTFQQQEFDIRATHAFKNRHKQFKRRLKNRPPGRFFYNNFSDFPSPYSTADAARNSSMTATNRYFTPT
jgi:hypothetical protein